MDRGSRGSASLPLPTRRRFMEATGAAAVGAVLTRQVPIRASAGREPARQAQSTLSGSTIDLAIRRHNMMVGRRPSTSVTVNGSLPGPVLRLREGDPVTIRVTNEMHETTSIHWHGLLVPFEMDGVPGVSFPGIRPGETFTYRFTARQSGTYWYHSHSGAQEQSGLYGPLLIEPRQGDPFTYDRDHVVMLADWAFEDPEKIISRLKKQGSYYNFGRRTAGDFFKDTSQRGVATTLSDRLMWGRMRMDPTDILDVTGHTFTYLVNGRSPEENWLALFKPGERVRLRFINAAAMTIFDVRIPGLQMTVVQADGQNVEPVTVEEFRMGPAETFDVIVQPGADQAYTIFAEAMDRSGFAAGTLASRDGARAPIPPRRERPLRTMADMGMGSMPDMPGMEMPAAWKHGPDHHGPGNSMVAEAPVSRLDQPGTGLDGSDRRVLVYTDLRRVEPDPDQGAPAQEIELHLTGNMERQMWSFNGKKYSEAPAPIPLRHGQRTRITLVNDTMMDHPMHLHGMWMVLENGAGERMPYKHTITVKGGEKLSFLVKPDEAGPFAFHCHLLYHMELGMLRVVSVAGPTDQADR